jgi:hypothetical protein
LSIAEAERQYEEAKTALESSWHQSELSALEGILAGINELKAAYDQAAEQQEAAAQAAAQAAEDQAAANQAAAQMAALLAEQQAAQQAALEAAQQAALEAAQQAAQEQEAVLSAEQRKQAALSNMDLYAEVKTAQIHREIESLNPDYLSMFQGYPEVEEVKELLLAQGFTPLSHYQQHGQYEDLQFSGGGIISGPSSGYQMDNATFHGTEAIIPYDDGHLNVQFADNYMGEMVSEIKSLRAEVAKLREENKTHSFQMIKTSQKIERNTDYLEEWDVEGIPEERTA